LLIETFIAEFRPLVFIGDEVQGSAVDDRTLKTLFDDARVDVFVAVVADFPDDVDGGEGNDYIVAMLTTIAEEAGDIATASGLGGDKLGAAIDKVRGVDESVAQTFQSMAEEMQ